MFLVVSWFAPPPNNQRIVVDHSALVSFIQYRSNAFDSVTANAMLDAMPPAEREKLFKDYVREEVLYREALALKLESSDYTIKRRLVQKMEFLATAAAHAESVSEARLDDFYLERREDYASPATATFTHVFVSNETRTKEETARTAATFLTQLISSGAGFEDSVKFGDRFLFHTNYVERSQSDILSQFGDNVTDAIFNTEFPLRQWSGPYFSSHGAHLIFLTKRTDRSLPSLRSIRSKVEYDYLKDQRLKLVDQLVADLTDQYTIESRWDFKSSDSDTLEQ